MFFCLSGVVADEIKLGVANINQVIPGISIDFKQTDSILSGHCNDNFALQLKLNPGQYKALVDWWLVQQQADGQLYYFDMGKQQFLNGLNTSYQGMISQIENMSVEADCELQSGLNFFYFGIDSIVNNILDLNNSVYASIAIKVAKSGTRQERLNMVHSWMYQIQELDSDGALDALAATEYPLLVLEPGQNFVEAKYDTDNILRTLRHTPSGKERLILAYIDIGQAEDYRDYWQPDWIAPTETQLGNPDFLITVDPDGWSGNYPVAYWRDEWKQLWIGKQGIVRQLAEMGFDGIYLDWVEAYDDESVIKVAVENHVDPATEMIAFIEQLGAAGKNVVSDFLVVPQNASYLLDADPHRYLNAIDGLAVEDTWFHGAGDAEWDSPLAGDLHLRHEDEWSTENRLAQYKKYQQSGIVVFAVDYCISPENADWVYREAQKESLRPLVTRVSLSQLTETPLR